jgi:hypothetical protein
MDFGLAFSYVFKDPNWLKKIAIISLVALIPIIGQIIVLGWSLEITKRVMNRNPEVLPDLDFGGDLTRGFMAFIISFVYTLPITLFSGLTSIFGTVMTNTGNDEVVLGIFSLVTICLSVFAVIYGIFVGLLLPAAFARYLAKDSIGAAFDFAEVFKMVQLNLGTYFIVLLGSIVAGFIAPMGLIACIIGAMLTYTYSLAVMGHFYGQAYLETTKNKAVIDIPPAA